MSVENVNKIKIGLTMYSKNSRKYVRSEAIKQMKRLREIAILRTPIGEINGGTAKKSWSRIYSNQGKTWTQLEIPYGRALDKGSIKGNRPWPNPGPRTVPIAGHIFSSQVGDGIPGIVDYVLSPGRKKQVARSILKAVTKGFMDELGRQQGK